MNKQKANEIIHEQIMGQCWHVQKNGWPHCNKCKTHLTLCRNPDYCEDANEAMKVFEMLRFREVRRFRGVPSGDMYWRVWSSNADERASTLCLAICTAALRILKIAEHIKA